MTVTNELYLGRFVKPFGIRGELKFVASDDFWPEVLSSRELVVQREDGDAVTRRGVSVERFRPHGGAFVVKLEDVETRNDAEGEVGGELTVDLDRLDVDLPGESRPFQVVGRVVKLEDGRVVGRVTSVVYSSAHPVYEVTGDEGVSLIPAVPEFIVEHDGEDGEITIRPIPGLIDG